MPFTISTNMNLPIPVVGLDPAPDYADNINSSLTLIDGHNHSIGSGVQITPDGLNISSDLTFLSNNATSLRSVRWTPQASPISLPTDLACAYVSGVDLYYNDGNGNQIRLTQSGSIAGTSGSISGLVSPASASYVSGSETFIWQADVNKPANMDFGYAILRNNVASSKGLTLQPPAAMSADYTITLPALSVSTKILRIDSSGNMSATLDVDNASLEISSNTLQVKNQGITQQKLEPRPTNLVAGPGEVALSASSGAATTGSTVFVPVVSCTLTTTGRPVRLMITSDQSTNSSYLFNTNNFLTFFFRDSTEIYRCSMNANTFIPSSVCSTMDYNLPAGTYTYYFGVAATSGGTIQLYYFNLIAYEI